VSFPWLRLCEGHWKAKQLRTNYFKRLAYHPPRTPRNHPPALTTSEAKLRSSYHRMTTRNPKPRLRSISHRITRETRPPEAPIASLQSTSHRMRTGLPLVPSEDVKTAGPSKRSKGKGKEVMTSDVHPTRLNPKKINAKLGKVTISFLFIKHLLKISRSTHCA